MSNYVDITGSDLVINIQYPDANENVVTTPLPAAFLPASDQKLLVELQQAPLSLLFDTYWSGTQDKNGQTLHDKVIDQMTQMLQNNGGYNISISIPVSGKLLAAADATLSLKYMLAGASVQATFTTDSIFGSWADPTFNVTADLVLELDSAIPATLCGFDFSGTMSAENINSSGGDITGDLISALANLFGVVPSQLPLGSPDLSELQALLNLSNAVCLDIQSVGFTQFAVSVDAGRNALTFTLIHPVDAAPTVYLGGNGAAGPVLLPPDPVITADRLQTEPGGSLTITGAGYPVPNTVSLALLFDDTTSGDVVSSDLQWGPSPSGPFETQSKSRQPYDGANFFSVSNLEPNTTYQFRVRDHDENTVTPWSSWATLTTSSWDASVVLLWLDNDFSAPLATASIQQDGTFSSTVTIPSSTTVGTHTVNAQLMGGALPAESVQITVLAAGAKYTPLLIIDTPYPIYEMSIPVHVEGFDAGTVNFALSSVTGKQIGQVIVPTDDQPTRANLMNPGVGTYQIVAWESDNGQTVQAAPVTVNVGVIQ